MQVCLRNYQYQYSIDSSDEVTIARWLVEAIGKLGPQAAEYGGRLELTLYPHFNDELKWTTKTLSLSVSPESLAALSAEIIKFLGNPDKYGE